MATKVEAFFTFPLCTECGGKITLHEGFISSPNYPSNYPANASCQWLIQTDATHTLQLRLKSLAIERSPNCINDSLQVYDGSVASADQLLLTSCGSEPNVTSVSSTGHEMLVTFKSNERMEAKGFQAEFMTVVTKDPILQRSKDPRLFSRCDYISPPFFQYP